jgi:hypothetical protein
MEGIFNCLMDDLQFLGLSPVWVVMWLWCSLFLVFEGLRCSLRESVAWFKSRVVVVVWWESLSLSSVRSS